MIWGEVLKKKYKKSLVLEIISLYLCSPKRRKGFDIDWRFFGSSSYKEFIDSLLAKDFVESRRFFEKN